MAQQPAEVEGSIASHHDHHTQRSTIQGLEAASANQIPIPIVSLFECSPKVDNSGLRLIFKTGLSLSILSSAQKLVIHDADRELTNDEWSGILSYSARCTGLQMLMFVNYILPDTFPVGSIPLPLIARNARVCVMRSFFTRRLDLQTGAWQASDIVGSLPGEEGFNAESYQRCLARFN